jgi:hypothetical protein
VLLLLQLLLPWLLTAALTGSLACSGCAMPAAAAAAAAVGVMLWVGPMGLCLQYLHQLRRPLHCLLLSAALSHELLLLLDLDHLPPHSCQ